MAGMSEWKDVNCQISLEVSEPIAASVKFGSLLLHSTHSTELYIKAGEPRSVCRFEPFP